RVGRPRARRRHEMPHDEFEILPLADELRLVAMLKPHHRATLALVVHEREDILEILTAMQVEELGGALSVVARQGMRRDVVDLLVADPDLAPVVERLEVLPACAQHRVRLPGAGYSWLFPTPTSLRAGRRLYYSSMDMTTIPRGYAGELDLHHLQVFDVLLREHSLTRAARVLNVTQPALSKTLARLRNYFSD